MGTLIPAGAGERMQYFSLRFNDCTIRFVLRYPGLLDPQRLKEAVRAVIDSVDVLHASFPPGNVHSHWRIHPDYDDSSCFHFQETAADPLDTALSLALVPVRPEAPVQLHCSLVQGPTSSAVCVTMSHLVTDGSDGRYLLSKLAEAYRLLSETGSCRELRVKNGSRAAEQVYQNLSKREFLSLLRSPFSSVKSTLPLPSPEPGEPRIVTQLLPVEVMDAARKKAKKLCGATVNDLLITALYHTYASVSGVDAASPISLVSMTDLRQNLMGQDSPGISNMSGTLPTLLPNGVQQSFEETLREIVRQTSKAKQDPLSALVGLPLLHIAVRTLPIRILEAAARPTYKNMSFGITNLGQTDSAVLAMNNLLPDALFFGGPRKKKPSVQVSAIGLDNACSLAIIGDYTQSDAAFLRSLLANMEHQLTAYAEIDL